MTEPHVASYGSWKSPITADLVISGMIRFGEVVLDGENTYWAESRPAEGGRSVIVRRTPDGRVSDVTPHPYNARTRVHEYGGGAFLASEDVVYFSNFRDQRVYRQDGGAAPRPITPEAKLRFADGAMDRVRNRIILVREDHTNPSIGPLNAIVALDERGIDVDQGGRILAWGNDFYSSPRISPDGSQLAWLTWDHPNMPWDGTELWVAQFDPAGALAQPKWVAGSVTESIFQPQWSPGGVLHFVSDRTGWWNIYRWRDGESEPLTRMEAEFGRPQWVFGMSTYAFSSSHHIVCSYTRDGRWHLADVDSETGILEEIPAPYADISSLAATESRAVFTAGAPTESTSLVQLDLETREFEVLRQSSAATVDPEYISVPRAIAFPTENGLTVHAFYYAPSNRDCVAPAGELPPLLVVSHGGPTGSTSSTLRLSTQYWTSRGIAVLDVNYGGSTGYGRAYRERLKGLWGVVDVDDCTNGALYLVNRGEVDGDRLIIRGGSAGGYTTLCALAFRDRFAAGASYYGVSDLEALAKETHKFESRYLDQMVGPYPQRQDLYRARSPIHFVDRLSCPIIFFQGLEDRVVPPNQAEMMVEALRRRGMPVAYVPFEGEQHGFRKAENLKRSLEAELYFYSQVFGFELAEPVEPVVIENLAPQR